MNVFFDRNPLPSPHKVPSRAHCCLLLLFSSVFLVSLFSDFLPIAFGGYADQRFFQVGLMVAVVVSGLIGGNLKFRQVDLMVTLWPIFIVAGLFLALSLPFANNEFIWVEPGLFAFFFLAFSVLGWRIRQEGLHQAAARLFVLITSVACFFYAAMTMTVYAFAINDHFSDLIDVIPWGFVNMRYWSHLATWLLPILPLALLFGPLSVNKKWVWSVSFAAGIWWWIVFMTAARGTMFSLVLAILVAIPIFGRSLFPWAKVFFRFVAFGVFAWLILSVMIPGFVFDSVAVRGIHAGSSGRFPLWWEAWLMSLESFPFGMGPQSWITHELISTQSQFGARLGHPHNMYLMWAAEYGWIMIAALMLLVCRVLKNLLVATKQIGSGKSAFEHCLVAFSISSFAGLFHAGLSAVFIVPASMAVGVCVLGIFWGLSQCDFEQGNVAADRVAVRLRPAILRFVMPVAFLVVGVFWAAEVWLYFQAMENDFTDYRQGPNPVSFPRFWFHGNFPRPDNLGG